MSCSGASLHVRGGAARVVFDAVAGVALVAAGSALLRPRPTASAT